MLLNLFDPFVADAHAVAQQMHDLLFAICLECASQSDSDDFCHEEYEDESRAMDRVQRYLSQWHQEGSTLAHQQGTFGTFALFANAASSKSLALPETRLTGLRRSWSVWSPKKPPSDDISELHSDLLNLFRMNIQCGTHIRALSNDFQMAAADLQLTPDLQSAYSELLGYCEDCVGLFHTDGAISVRPHNGTLEYFKNNGLPDMIAARSQEDAPLFVKHHVMVPGTILWRTPSETIDELFEVVLGANRIPLKIGTAEIDTTNWSENRWDYVYRSFANMPITKHNLTFRLEAEAAWVEQRRQDSILSSENVLQVAALKTISTVPRWDRDGSKLFFGDVKVRDVSRRAKNIIPILEAFQEESWPPRIFDPLPQSSDSQKMRETIKTLNKGLERIRFRADGTGEGIEWFAE